MHFAPKKNVTFNLSKMKAALKPIGLVPVSPSELHPTLFRANPHGIGVEICFAVLKGL